MLNRKRKNVGVIGLGIIGQRVSASLRARGFHVFVWNRTPRAVPNFVGSPGEVVELCDFIQIFVSDDEALLQMTRRIARDLNSDHIVMAHSTVSPDTMRATAEIVEKRGARFLDAPFTGSKMAAEKGELVYYVGGDEATLQQARPVLEASSKEILAIGKVGDATTVKVATNIVTAASVQAAAEALAVVFRSGVPLEKFAEAMRNNGSNSGTLDMKLPMMMEGNFEPHFSAKHMLKDLLIATRQGRASGLELTVAEASRGILAEEMRRGRGDDDYSSLVRQYLPADRFREGGEQGPFPADDHPQLSGFDEVKTPDVASEGPALTPPVQPGAEVESWKEEEVSPEPEKKADAPATPAPAEASKATVENPPPGSLVALPKPDPEAKAAVQSDAPGETEPEKVASETLGNFWRRHTDN